MATSSFSAEDDVKADRIAPVHASSIDAPAETSASAPIGKSPGIFTNIGEFFNRVIFTDFYNSFRLTGYLAEAHYSDLQRHFDNKFEAKTGKIEFSNKQRNVFLPDINPARQIVNRIESAAFLTVALIAFIRDRKQLRSEVGDVVAAEVGKEKRRLGLMDMLGSDNPLVQTATNRFKSLYIMRFIQPLSFLYGLKLGITSTVFEIVAERAAYFENNSYDKLQILAKEITNNEWGAWSREGVVNQLVNIIQKNRLEHKSSPLSTQELEKYFPLLHKVADRMIEKKWHLSDAVHVLGQVIKEPALPDRAEIAYQEAEAGLPLMMKKRTVTVIHPLVQPAIVDSQSPPQELPTKAFADKIAEASPKSRVPITSYAEKAIQDKNSRPPAAGIA